MPYLPSRLSDIDESGRIGLSPAGFDEAFPFHIACDKLLNIVQVGYSIGRIAPEAQPGVALADVFVAARPSGPLTPAMLVSREGALTIMEHRATRIPFRGQFVRLANAAGWVFLGSPWFPTAQSMQAAGVDLNDFAPHDPIAELLLMTQTQHMAIRDLQTLNERLERKARQVRETEALYRAAISAAKAVPYREDFASDTFTYVGDGFQVVTGFPPGELPPSQLRKLASPAETPDEEAEATRLFDGGAAMRRRTEYRLLSPDGRMRWINDASVVIQDARGVPVGAIGTLYDVTAQKDAQDQLRRSEAEARRLAIVASRTDSAVAILDARRRVEWVNDGFTRLFGYSVDDVHGRMFREVFDISMLDVNRMFERAQAALLAGEPFIGEVRMIRKDGSPVWIRADVQPLFDEQGALQGFTAVGTNITEAKRYQLELEQVSAELTAILGVIPGGVVAFDANGRFAYCNSGFESLMGRNLREMAGLTTADFDVMVGALCDSQRPPATFLELEDCESDVLHFANPPRVVTRTACLVHGTSAAAKWRAYYLRDVTRETEVDRMKSEFLSTAAHELRTPMSSVHGFAELLMSREFDADTSRTIARTIHRQSSLLVQMVNELLDLARIEAGRGRDFVIETQPLAPLVQDTAAGMLVTGDPRRVEFVPAAGDAARVSVDGQKLRLALTNVLGNAYKYSRGQGAIRVWLPTRRRFGRREVGIRVQDEGVGMTPEQVERIFERFYRAEPAGDVPGTGLGMTLVKEIVEAMRGVVEVSSEPGRGTTVTLWLPAA